MEVKKKCLPLQSQTENGVHKRSEFGSTSSLKRLITVQEASTEKNTIYREALISLEIIHDELSRQGQAVRGF